jgi:hypothetical protein
MKLNKDLFPTDMNMVELDGKKVLIQPSQAESTNGKEVIIGEKRPPRMLKPKYSKDGQWKKNERSKSQECPKVTFDICNIPPGLIGLIAYLYHQVATSFPEAHL